ncbi:expressed protein [Chlorella variabilis]|uniref:Expressed protein n=1 Tax=Chlorella variabilis TaxID=554065 RepID=E1Z9R6_CHLVA|nr:expressed protein [Chlorella variabilis]EFN57571.1 expressed protein [Chlorella variabilis]|eukprot:XP_005849673.1 expressed protein [Chlorella variabilis]
MSGAVGQRGCCTVAGPQSDPSKNPNYRRGSQNDYWRKRTEDRRSSKGKSVSTDNQQRRRGRPAHMRSPDDTPLRDGNRDRLMGLLTTRAASTMAHTVEEDNPALHSWLNRYLQENDIPKDGNWSDVSGENFLRTLLTRPVEEISGSFSDEEPQFANASPVGGDPRQTAQRIMDLRHQIAKEWIEELQSVPEENSVLMQETLLKSLSATPDSSAAGVEAEGEAQGQGKGRLRKVNIEEVDDSAAGCDD